jgi:hypothetical protein
LSLPNSLLVDSLSINSKSHREKRNVLTGVFSYITGLATEEEISRIQNNEIKLAFAEKLMSEQIMSINSQSKQILSSLQQQSSKISELYNDEMKVKDSLKTLLSDTSDSISKINQIMASLEIFSDVSVEFSTVFAILDLLPYLITDLHDALLSIATQSITEKLIPPEDLSLKVPVHRRQSLLTSTIVPAINADSFVLYINVPEYYSAFNLCHIRTIPFNKMSNNSYNFINLEKPVVAANSLRESFLYDSNICTTQNTVNVCPAELVSIHNTPITCAEAMATGQSKYFYLCIAKATIVRPTTQSYIFMNKMQSIRLFSPFPDTVTLVCPAAIQQNATNIVPGNSDLSFHPSCSIKISQLNILSPAKITDTTQLEIESSIPDLSSALENIANDIELSQKVNLSVIVKDFEKFSNLIDTENIDIAKVKETLDQINAIKQIKDFQPLEIDLEDPTSLSTSVAAASFGVNFLFIIVTLILMQVCCPNVLKCILQPIFKIVTLSVTCLWTTCTEACITACKRRTPPSLPPQDPLNTDYEGGSMSPSAPSVRFRNRQADSDRFLGLRLSNYEQLPKHDDTPATESNRLSVFESISTQQLNKEGWFIKSKQRRAQLYLGFEGEMVCFDVDTLEVKTLDGKPVPECPLPSKADMADLNAYIERAVGPKIYMNGAGNWYIEGKPEYIVDLNKGTVTNIETNRPVHGYNIPKSLQIRPQPTTTQPPASQPPSTEM